MDVEKARKGLALFIGLVAIGSIPLILVAIRSGYPAHDERQVPVIIALMWVPALASFITRLILREGFEDISFRFGGLSGLKAIVITLCYPIVIGSLAYGIASLLHLVKFAVPETGFFLGLEPPILRFSLTLLLAVTLFAVVGLISAAGEEIGWRGYLVPRLVDAGVPFPLVISGLIWAAWHLPGIFGGIYAAGPIRWLSALLFLGFGIGLSVLWGRLRLTTGSVWPAMLGHAAWNQAYPLFERYFKETEKGFWLGESGILSVAVILAVTFCIDRFFIAPKAANLPRP